VVVADLRPLSDTNDIDFGCLPGLSS
jgi:hypothetical protein